MSVLIASLLTFVQLPRQNCKAQDNIADAHLEDAKRKNRKERRGSGCRTGTLMSDKKRSDAVYSFDTVVNGTQCRCLQGAVLFYACVLYELCLTPLCTHWVLGVLNLLVLSAALRQQP